MALNLKQLQRFGYKKPWEIPVKPVKYKPEKGLDWFLARNPYKCIYNKGVINGNLNYSIRHRRYSILYSGNHLLHQTLIIFIRGSNEKLEVYQRRN